MYRLTTPYYDTMDKSIPHNYHPTPQFKRNSFFCLNGTWKFTLKLGEETVLDTKIRVPFCPESMASGVECVILPEHVMHYEKHFIIPEGFADDRIILHFGAVDQICKVLINDNYVGENKGGYLPFSFDITDWLVPGANKINVIARDGINPKYPYGKQRYKRGGIWYTPVSGIWQTVWLESVPEVRIKSLYITPLKNGVTVKVVGGENHKRLTVKETGEVYEFDGDTVEITPENPQLWTPETPYLYNFTVECGRDRIESYFAIRTLSIERINGVKRICLNGKPYLFNGMLDQGYYPEGIYTPVTEDGFIEDIKLAKSLGFNMLRKHIKVEPMIFYYLCDKMGIAVFQDMVNNGKYKFLRDTILPTVATYQGQKLNDEHFSPDEGIRKTFENSMYDTADLLMNSPSVVYYTIFNEGWGQFNADKMYGQLCDFDHSRIIDSTSGWFRQTRSDVDSRHIYFRKLAPKNLDGKALVISEFGGYSYKVKDHIFCEKEYGYRAFKTQQEYENAVCALYENEVKPLAKRGVSALVYTQVSDVEEEINGFITYDRRVVKINADRLKSINEELKNISEK